MSEGSRPPETAASRSADGSPSALAAGAGASASNPAAKEQAILEQLKKIYDPEIPMNIVDLGLIYGFEWTGDKVQLRMTLTAPGCPVAGILAEEVKAAVEGVTGPGTATVEMIWDPPWTPDRMSEFAKRQFGYA